MASLDSKELVVLLDGQRVAARDAKVSIFDHGFLFGDSVYEVVRTVSSASRPRRLFAFDSHMERLEASARGISLELPWTRSEQRSAVERAVACVEGASDVYVRIIVTRGVGELDLAPDSCRAPSTIVIAKPLPVYPREWYERGIALRLVATMRNPSRSLSPSIKSGNYLNNVLALMEARRAGALDAAMLNEHGFLTECTTSNLFFVKNGELRTPSLECGILSGITRSLVLDLARGRGVPVREGSFDKGDLRGADEAFITSTTKDIVPVGQVDGEALPSAPGKVTKALMEAFSQHVASLLAKERAPV